MQRTLSPHRPRVVLVADWLTGMRGGEKCLEVAARRWPNAPLYTLLHKRGSTSQAIESLPIRTSFPNAIPGVDRLYRHLLPLMPLAVSSLHLPPADLVLSFSHCVAKGVRPARTSARPTPHVCYCYTPMRYAWQMREAYFGHVKGLRGRLLGRLLDELRDWDRRTASHVTHFIAISRTVQARIRESYDMIASSSTRRQIPITTPPPRCVVRGSTSSSRRWLPTSESTSPPPPAPAWVGDSWLSVPDRTPHAWRAWPGRISNSSGGSPTR